MNQNDLRVRKTRNNIESVFLSLLMEKDFHKITIHTDSIHLYEDMSDFLQKSFYESQKLKNKQSPEILDYLSNLYAAIVLTAMKWCLKNKGYKELTKHTQLFMKLDEVFEYTSI